MIRQVLIFVFVLFFSRVLPAGTYTVSGYVIDQETGETLIGANVLVVGESEGAATDGNGFFRITGLGVGKYQLNITYIGYASREMDVTITHKSLMLDEIALTPKAVELQQIMVTAPRSEIADLGIESGHRELMPDAIRNIPTAQGDVFKALKYLPGVEGVDPMSPLFAVRGGEPGENLILLDGVTIYNPYHFVTATSLFNLYAIKKVEMLVGGFGAEYGGRNASVLYITTREGNDKELHGEIEPTTTHTKMVFDFPVGSKATMMISGRVYYDLISRYLFYSPSYFYDMNVSLNWKINSKNRLSLRYFHSRDFMDMNMNHFMSYFSSTFDTDLFDDYNVILNSVWKNQAATAILKTVINPNIYLKTQISGSFFTSNNLSALDFKYDDEENHDIYKLTYSTDIRNRIRDIGGKTSLSIQINPCNLFMLGGEYNRYYFVNDMRINDFGEGKTTRSPWLFAGFTEDKITIGPFSLRGGWRFSKYSDSNEWSYEPRLNGACHLSNTLRIKGAWGQYYQYIISINSQEYEISQFLDYYYPLKNRKPSASTHTIIGFEKSFPPNSQLSVDFYYKDISRVYTFDYNISESEAYHFSDKIKTGEGKSYGLEILWKGVWKKFSGWVSYGLSRTTRSYSHIMDGKSFLYDYDRTHSFKAMITYQVHPALFYSGTLRILSGVPKTMETAIKSYYYYDPETDEIASYPIYVTDKKNNARFPMYISLDLGLKKRIRKGFGANLAEFLGARESYLNITFGNLLFFYRNVLFYIPMGEEKMWGLGTNYVPTFSLGYTIKF